MIRWERCGTEWSLFDLEDDYIGSVKPRDDWEPALFYPAIGDPSLTLDLARAIADKLEELEKGSED